MRKRFTRRAIVAAGLALSFVVSSTPSAQAGHSQPAINPAHYSGPVYALWDDSTFVYGATGYASLATTEPGAGTSILDHVIAKADTYKTNRWDDHCAETWVDAKLINGHHHAPDVFINCDFWGNNTPWYNMHWSGSSGPTTTKLHENYLRDTPGGVGVCLVNTRTWVRDSGNCATKNIDLAGIKKHSTKTPQMLRATDNWDEPDLIAPDRDGLDFRFNGQTLESGSAFVSWSGRYRVAMQTDGNFVVYHMPGNGSQSVAWASNTDGNPGAYGVQQTDGNFVIRASNGACLFHSATYGQDVTAMSLLDSGHLYSWKANWTRVTPQWQGC